MFRKTLFFMTTLLPLLQRSGAFFSRGVGSPYSFVRYASKKKGGDGSGEFGRSLVPRYSPRTTNQKQYVQYLEDPTVSILLGVGPAGTGKTLFACSAAVQEMKRGSVQKIILTRPVVPVEEDIGFLPGSLINKMDPWTRPIFDILGEFYSKRDIDIMLDSGAIEISPLAFMRGRTFKRAFVIADEMQNSSPNQMLMLTTRLGQSSKMVITGDLAQSDRPIQYNGLADLMGKLRAYNGVMDNIKMVEMGREDVERSAAVSKILDIYSFAPSTDTIFTDKIEKNVTVIGTQNTPFPIVLQDCALIPNDPLDRRLH
jgi:phosphate starvation-inducible protein PhoH and related proteins